MRYFRDRALIIFDGLGEQLMKLYIKTESKTKVKLTTPLFAVNVCCCSFDKFFVNNQRS